MGTRELKHGEDWDDLFTAVDQPLWALEQFLGIMADYAEGEADPNLERHVEIAQTLFKDAVAKIETRTKQIEAKLGGRVQVVFSGDDIIKANIAPPDKGGIPDFRTVEADPEIEHLYSLLAAIEDYLNHEDVDLPVTLYHMDKLFKALREGPQELLRIVHEKVMPFLNGLPDTDKTVIGGTTSKDYCLDCLTEDEKAEVAEIGTNISKDWADRFDTICARCGKHLSGGAASRPDPDGGEGDDFRTVRPESEEDGHLQRTFEVMRQGGKDWELLEGAITLAYGSCMRRDCELIEKMRALVQEGRIEKSENTREND